MFDAHHLIAEYGVRDSVKFTRNKNERVCLAAAAAILSRDGGPTEVLHGGLVATCFPQRRPKIGAEEAVSWSRDIWDASYRVESGFDPAGCACALPFGLPFGAKARRIMLWLHDMAVRSQSPVLDMPKSVTSMHAWTRQFAAEVGGMTYRTMVDQALRIATCNVALASRPNESGESLFPMVDTVVVRDEEVDPRLGRPLMLKPPVPQKIFLNRAFFECLIAEPVPLNAHAIRLIDDNSWAIDLYVSLAYHLPRLTQPVFMTWRDFCCQFSVGEKNPLQIKTSFLATLPLVRAVYPQAHVAAGPEGVELFPSRGPV